MHKPTPVAPLRTLLSKRDIAMEVCWEESKEGRRGKGVSLLAWLLREDVMGSVSGPVAEIIRSDSRIIKERISTRCLPRIISGVEIFSEDPGCRFLARGISRSIGNRSENIENNNVTVIPCPRVRIVIK